MSTLQIGAENFTRCASLYSNSVYSVHGQIISFVPCHLYVWYQGLATPVSTKQIHEVTHCSFVCSLVVGLLWWHLMTSSQCAFVYTCCLRQCMSFVCMSCASHIFAYALMPIMKYCISWLWRPPENVTQADILYCSPVDSLVNETPFWMDVALWCYSWDGLGLDITGWYEVLSTLQCQ